MEFQRHMSWLSFFAFSGSEWDMIVSFVDIGGIIDEHCLNFKHQ
jgi:hypothetical protein